MTDRFKLVFIGAGSFRFSLGLFRNVINATDLFPMEVALCDIDPVSLDIMTRLFKRMVKKRDIIVTSSTDRTQLLGNANAVIKSISVGMQESEWVDVYLPLKFGIPQNTGDTVGPGGLFRGLRTDPACADIAIDMKKLCPKAPLLNYTNPNSTCTLAGRTAAMDVDFIGLCHELFGGMKLIKRYYNSKQHKNIKQWQDMDIQYAGINHFGWITKFEYNGEDLTPLLKKDAHKLVLEKFHNIDSANAFNFHLLEKYDCFPYPGARHVAEFIPEYYNYFNREIQCPYWKFPLIRSVGAVNNQRHLAYFGFNLWAKGLLPALGPRQSGELAIEMIRDGYHNKPTEYVVNLPNKGIVPELPEDCIVEVSGQFKEGVMTPIKTIHLPHAVAELIKPHAIQQRLTVDAALGNKYELVLKAMLHEPMCSFIEDDDKIEYITKLMLYYEQKWLPSSWKEWIPKE
jgi:alpha-galactosidase